MKRIALLLLFALPALGQNIRWDSTATTTTGVGTLVPILAMPGAAVAFFNACTSQPCSPTRAITYTDALDSTQCPSGSQVVWQPSSNQACTSYADSRGNFGGYFQPGAYLYTVTSGGLTSGPYQFNVGGGGGSSGVSQIIAGSNITISPTNGLGAVTVNSSGGGALPTATQIISGKGDGTGVGMPEKGTNIVADQAFVAWDEDTGMGRFDCRDTKYAGGCLGSTPQAAMQAWSDDMTCYEAITGKHATSLLPPGVISVGTVAFPTLSFAPGSYVRGPGGPGGDNGPDGVLLAGTYNNHDVLDVGLTRSATCSDGNVHVDTLNGGSWERFSVLGCSVGGCSNLPGDTTLHWLGGPGNVGINILNGAFWVDQLTSLNTGGDGIILSGLDARVGQLFVSGHDQYFAFGINQAGENYQFSASEAHAAISLEIGDGVFYGPFEDYGTVITPGYEYGHIFGVIWGGGSSFLGRIFSQRDEIGLLRPFGQLGGTSVGGRIDGPLGDGVWAFGADTYGPITTTSDCTYDGLSHYLVDSATIATPGSGQTNGTYLLNASSGSAQLSVTVAGGIVTVAAITVHGTGYSATPPTFTLAAGGTPGTFTVTMRKIFANASVAPQGACDNIRELNTNGGDIFNSPVTIQNIPIFGTSFATGDYYGFGGATWILPSGTSTAQTARWDQPPGYYIAQGQRIVLADQTIVNGGTVVTGTTADLEVTGTHIRMGNATPTTFSAFNNARMMQDVWIFGDGFTTFPETLVHSCSGHDLLVNNNQWYHLFVSNGEFFSAPILTEQCDPPAVVFSSETVASSATPTFSTATRASITTLTANITIFTLAAGADGQEKTLTFCQNGTGSFTVAAPSNVHGFFTIGATASKCSAQHFTYSAVQTAWLADSAGVTNQ